MSREIRLETEVPGTPEQVWEAIATGPGIASWFVPAELDRARGRRDQLRLRRGLRQGGRRGHRLGAAAPLRLQGPRDGRRPARLRMARRGALGRHVRRAARQLRLRRGRRLGRDVRRHEQGLDAVPRLPAPPHGALRRAALPAGPRPRDDRGRQRRGVGRAHGRPRPARRRRAGRRRRQRPRRAAARRRVERFTGWGYVLRLEAPAPGYGFVAAEPCSHGNMLSAYLYLYDLEPADAERERAAWAAWFAARYPAENTAAGAA